MKGVVSFFSFGTFLQRKRIERDISLREMARRMGVSAPFLSDVEKNRTAPLTTERLYKVSDVLSLTVEEQNEMFDIVGWQKNTLPPDVETYLLEHNYIIKALRISREMRAEEVTWKQFISELESSNTRNTK